MALTLVLLAGAGIFVKSFVALKQVPPKLEVKVYPAGQTGWQSLGQLAKLSPVSHIVLPHMASHAPDCWLHEPVLHAQSAGHVAQVSPTATSQV